MAKSTYVLIPGAGSGPWYWHRARPFLEERGHEVVTPDLPVEDDSAGLEAYVAEIERAVGDREDVVVVGQSMGGLAATVFASRRPVRRLVLLAPMIPAPGETGGDYWHNTGQPEAARELAEREGRDPDSFDPFEIFLHDVPEEVAHASGDHARDQSDRPFADPVPISAWPQVETRVIACRHDRLFPLEYMRDVSRERLGIEPDIIDTGHVPALADPQALVDLLESYDLP